MRDFPSIKEILHTPEGIGDKPMRTEGDLEAEIAELKEGLIWALSRVSVDATLREVSEYYRLASIVEIKHVFDATGSDESNEPDICAKCGHDIRSGIHGGL